MVEREHPRRTSGTPDLWNFDISEMEEFLSKMAMLICYADDCGFLYEITEGNKWTVIDQINKDLEALMDWG